MPLDGTGFSETTTERDLHVLRHARAGIARPSGWCQSEMRHDGSWCAAGWISLAVPGGGRDGVNRRMRLLRRALPWWRRLFSSDHAATFAVVG